MTNLEVVFNRTDNVFNITNTSGGDVTLNIYSLDTNNNFVLELTTVLSAAVVYTYSVSNDGLYKFEDDGEAEYIIHFADVAITNCLTTISKEILCGDFDCNTITSFNSIVMTSQLLYNLLEDTFVNTEVLQTLANSQITTLSNTNTLINRLTTYCNTLDDCGC